MVNHITKDGSTATSSHIAHAIRQSLDLYLEYWNDEPSSREERDEEMEAIVEKMWEDMADLAELDEMSETGRDWFAELEQQAKMLEGLVQRYVRLPPPH